MVVYVKQTVSFGLVGSPYKLTFWAICALFKCNNCKVRFSSLNDILTKFVLTTKIGTAALTTVSNYSVYKVVPQRIQII